MNLNHVSLTEAASRPLPGPGPLKADEVRAYLDGVMKTLWAVENLPGASVVIVYRGQLLLSRGYGKADIEEDREVDPARTRFRVGSVSKLVTWTAVMQLLERGELDLDTDINQYLDFALPDTFAEPVTLRHLMTHTAGFEDNPLGHMISRDQASTLPMGQALARHMPARVRPPTRDFCRADNWSYSNWGAALAGHIVALRSGMRFEDYVAEHIFAPLGMQHSSFVEPPTDKPEDMATGYTKDPKAEGGFAALDDVYSGSFAPASCLSSTAEDMGRFMLAQLGHTDGPDILSPEHLAQLHARAIGQHPGAGSSALGFFEWEINGRRVIGHGGRDLHFHAHLALLPEEDLGIFVACNCNAQPESAAYVVQAFLDRYFPGQLPEIKAPAGFAAEAERYTGTYRVNQHSSSTHQKLLLLDPDAQIRVHADGDDGLRIDGLEHEHWVPLENDVFRARDSEQMICFSGMDNGKAHHLIGPESFMAAHRLPLGHQPRTLWLLLALSLILIAAPLGLVNHPAAMIAGATLGVNLAILGLLLNGLRRPVVELACRIPTPFRLALHLVWPSLLGGIALVAAAVSGWLSWPWLQEDIWNALSPSLGALGAVLFARWLHHWNLIGYRYA